MAEIAIRRTHSKTKEEARRLADQVAQEMQREFGMVCHWQEDILRFSRPGVSGSLSVSESYILFEAKLGILLSAIQPRIEAEINGFLDKHFC